MSDFIILSGISGAGKTSAMKAFEDCGYKTIYNYPINMLSEFLKITKEEKLVILIDILNVNWNCEFFRNELQKLRDKLNVRFVFLDCEDYILHQRHIASRREPPLTTLKNMSTIDAIKKEKQELEDVKEFANFYIDTTEVIPGILRSKIFDWVAQKSIKFYVTSFGFPFGIPKSANLVFDLRCFKNPHYYAELKDFTGLDKPVQEFIEKDNDFAAFYKNVKNMLDNTLDLYQKDGRSYFEIAAGCTGGKHRSVYTAHKISKFLTNKGLHVIEQHRELIRKNLIKK